ncbi:hypothetical protein DSO57_1001940 [Entomophthora muscae]|uniref:Uncharacterized protein n=1 Tax=Entomophthora muscae TaxID=34485 RepID=A0ACC2UVT6_9FUNG|nr:hypothetical protein DSO57_1001940 [Entomophthora muscae]
MPLELRQFPCWLLADATASLKPRTPRLFNLKSLRLKLFVIPVTTPISLLNYTAFLGFILPSSEKMFREGKFREKTPFASASQHDLRKARPQTVHTSNYGTFGRSHGKYMQDPDPQPSKNRSPFLSNLSSQESDFPPENSNSEAATTRRPPGAADRSLPSIKNMSSHILAASSTNNIMGLKYVNKPRAQETSRSHAVPTRMHPEEASRISRGNQASSLNLNNLSGTGSYLFTGYNEAPTQPRHSKPIISSHSDDSLIDGEPLRYFRDEDSEASEDDLAKESSKALGLTDTNSSTDSVQLSKLEKENRELQLLLSQSKATVGTLSSELSKAQFHITELNAQLKESTSKQIDLVDKLKTVTLRCIQAERNLQDKTSANSNLTQQLERVEGENERLGDENDRLSSEISLLRRQSSGGWDNPRHRSQIKERADFASAQLEIALNDARSGIMTLLKGVDNVKRVKQILTSIDQFYPEPDSSPCQPLPSNTNSPHSIHPTSP